MSGRLNDHLFDTQKYILAALSQPVSFNDLVGEVYGRLPPIQFLNETSEWDKEAKTVTITWGMLCPVPSRDLILTCLADLQSPMRRQWLDDLGAAPAVLTIPRTDEQARRRLPAQPGVQLYYGGLRAYWGKSIEQSFIEALAFARNLGL